MSTDQIIQAISVLTEVVKANSVMIGCYSTKHEANEKIKELIKLL